MASATLNQIFCHRTEDLDGIDELKLAIHIDGELKEVFRHSMLPGHSWRFDRNYEYKQELIFRLWEEDQGDTPSLLAEQRLTNKAHKGKREKKYDHPKAVYWLQYTVEKTPEFVKKERTRVRVGGKGNVKPKKQTAPSQKKPTRASGGGDTKNIEVVKDAGPILEQMESSIMQFKEFRPSLHGMPFRNRFKFKLRFRIPFIPKIASTYGLCGGMSSLAADCFQEHQTVPFMEEPPAIGTGLYSDLLDRQLKSFGKNFMHLLTFFQWWRMYSTHQTQQKTLKEWQQLKLQLDNGQPCQLGIMYVDEHTGSLWDNHQVLAYAYEQPNNEIVYIRIYDPNFPKRDDIYLKGTFNEVNDGSNVVQRLVCEQVIPDRGATKIRGFFRLPMKLIKPEKHS